MATTTSEDVLKQLITDIDATGGLIKFSDGNHSPKADPSWLDLGMTVVAAEKALIALGYEVSLSVEEVEYSSCEIGKI